MPHIVTKPFATTRRRFAAGQVITAEDLDGLVALARWVKLGHVELQPDVAAAPAPPLQLPPEPPAPFDVDAEDDLPAHDAAQAFDAALTPDAGAEADTPAA